MANLTNKEQFIETTANYLLAGGYVTSESGANVVAEELYRANSHLIITNEVAADYADAKAKG
jgi:hypothetical protein